MKLPKSVNVLLLGGGGREDALASKIAQSPRTARLFIAPGNGGTLRYGTNVEVSPANFGSIKQFVLTNNINLVVVGPEEPLVKGIYDFFNNDSDLYHVPVIGPSCDGAKLEGSKEFAKEFMTRHKIPTARFGSFTKDSIEQGVAFLKTLSAPYVLKADGLAAGKGVVIPDTLDEAEAELREMLGGKFGAASATVVIEEFLSGIECSVFVATDGKEYKILPVAKDYKRIGQGDTGLNTGGMGAVSPVAFADEIFMDKVKQRIIEPTIAGLASEKIIYKGFIFIGLISVGGEPFVIEYNVRLGDPETEVVIPRITSDIMSLFEGIAFNSLNNYELTIDPRYAVTVVAVAGGYPGEYEKGNEISGLESSSQSMIFHAGTTVKRGKVLTNGGRVVTATSLDETLRGAIDKSYQTLSQIEFKEMYYRRDIGDDILKLIK